eukprot:5882478-Pleurochrysis_carterae.AAC.1
MEIRPPYFSTPPRASIPVRALCVDIYDFVTHFKKHAERKWFREEICQILHCVDEWHRDVMLFHPFADKEVSSIDVLRALMVLRVVR